MIRGTRTARSQWPWRTQVQSGVGPVTLAAFVVLCAAPRRGPAGTVAEQRARLPPPAQCEDLVEGIWRSHDFRPQWQEWTVFTLEIHRVDGTDRLRGTIRNESWEGEADRSEPGPCEGAQHFVASMDAEGQIDGPVIDFGGVAPWRIDATRCGEALTAYNLDRFTGALDPERLEFQSVNNDGGDEVNLPVVFRRVGCLPPQEGAQAKPTPTVVVKAPAFYPPEPATGGGCGL